MQSITGFIYPLTISARLNLGTYDNARSQVVFSKIPKVYRGVDNQIYLQLKNSDQKPVSLDTCSVILNVLNDEEGQILLSKSATVTKARAHATMKVVSATLADAGEEYIPSDVLTVAGGTRNAAATFTVTTTKVVDAVINVGGSGYTNGTQVLTVSTGTGTSATLNVTVVSGVVTEVVSIRTAGSYTVNPTLTGCATTATAGSGCTVDLVMGVNTLTNNNVASQAYTVLPTLTNNEPSGGSGSGAKLNLSMGVEGVTVDYAGAGYYLYDVILSGGGYSTIATATATVDPISKEISTVTITSSGAGYTAIPTITFQGDSNGTAIVTLTELDMLELDARFYRYSIAVTDSVTGLEVPVYADDNYGVRNDMEVLGGHYPLFKESIDVTITTIGAAGTYTSNVASDTPTRRSSSEHTVQFYFADSFNGSIIVQGTLDDIPPNGVNGNGDALSWANITTLTFVDQDTPDYYNWSGVYTAFRFVINKTSGDVTKILFRS